jgi:hypothetical protein
MKKKIDKYFSDNYTELLELASKAVEIDRRNYDPSDLIAHAYEYCIKKIDQLETEEDIHRFTYRVILMHSKWRTSPINREILLTQTPFEGTEDFEIRPVEKECEMAEKILLEKWFNDKQSILAMYRERIKVDKPKLIVLDKMLEFKTTNSRRLGKHFGIHHLSAWAYIKEIQEEIRDFEEEVNNYDKKNNTNR